MPRRIKAHLVKSHRTYRLDQLADVVGVTVQTVRKWCKQGLPCMTDKKPFLIRGRDFKDWHSGRIKSRKRPLGRFEIYCLGCKRPKEPEQGLVDLEEMGGGRSRIVALCPCGGCMMRRIVGAHDLPDWAARFGFALTTLKDA